MARLKWKRGWAPQMMNSAAASELVEKQVSRTVARLPEDDYGSAVEGGGDRVRGAIWTKSARAMRRNARDNPELLRALGGGASSST